MPGTSSASSARAPSRSSPSLPMKSSARCCCIAAGSTTSIVACSSAKASRSAASGSGREHPPSMASSSNAHAPANAAARRPPPGRTLRFHGRYCSRAALPRPAGPRVRALPAPRPMLQSIPDSIPRQHAPVPRRDGMTIERPWLAHYPAGVPAESTSTNTPPSRRCSTSRSAFTATGPRSRTWASASPTEVETLSNRFAAYLLGELRLKKGDRVAIMMPTACSTRSRRSACCSAGLTVVNVNPMYTARELKHQMVDSGASVILVLDNFARTVRRCCPRPRCST